MNHLHRLFTASALLWVHAVSAGDVNFKDVTSGHWFYDVPTSLYLVRDSDHWEKIWRERHPDQALAPRLPEIDFDRNSVIGFDSGWRPSSDYSVRITRVVEQPEKITLYIEEQAPGDGCVVLDMMTSSYTFVSVSAALKRKPMDFSVTLVAVPCRGSPNKTMEPTR